MALGPPEGVRPVTVAAPARRHSAANRAGDVLTSRPAKTIGAAAAAVAAWALTAVFAPSGAPMGVVVIGAVLGSVTALLAMGLILIYRTNRIVNFAYGALGGIAGILAVELFLAWKWNYFLALATGVSVGVVVGGAVEVAVIRRFAGATRLVLTVATIGLAQLLGGIELLVPRLFGSGGLIMGGFSTPLQTRVNVAPVIVTGDHLLIVAVVPVVIAGLAWFLLRTDAGVAVRAAAENADRARLLGIPIRRLSTMVWMIAGGLSALTFCLRAPFQGVAPGVLSGPQLLLPALAAAVIAGMESLPVAFAAGIGLGVVEQVVLWNTSKASAADVAFLVLILVALLARRDRLTRAHESGAGTWTDTAVVRAVPRELRRLPEVRIARGAVTVVLLVAAGLLPWIFGPSVVNLLSVALVWGIVAVSLVVLTGWGGHISLGQFAIVGTGAICAGNLIVRAHLDLFLALGAAGCVGAVTALLLGLPALRIRGAFLAVTTFAFAVTLDSFVLNPNNFPSLVPQDVPRPVLWARFDLESETVMYYFCLAFLLLAVAVALGVRRTRSGRILIATRDNRRAAEAMGLGTTWVNLSGFVLAGVIAGVAGGLHVVLLHGARAGSYPPSQSIDVFSTAVIGGLGSVGGALLGVFGMRGLDQVADEFRLLLTGTGLLVILLVVPGGLGQIVVGVRTAFLRVVARRRRLLVPSLLEDRRRPDVELDLTGHVHPADETTMLSGALAREDQKAGV